MDTKQNSKKFIDCIDRVNSHANNRCINCGTKAGHKCEIQVYRGLTKPEHLQRERLIELQKDNTLWFGQERFDALEKLNNKLYEKNKGKI
ncbi:MAG: hypothetical protein ACJA2M_003135 [Polaribacter sp.]|jgi:hypothetical protein